MKLKRHSNRKSVSQTDPLETHFRPAPLDLCVVAHCYTLSITTDVQMAILSNLVSLRERLSRTKISVPKSHWHTYQAASQFTSPFKLIFTEFQAHN